MPHENRHQSKIHLQKQFRSLERAKVEISVLILFGYWSWSKVIEECTNTKVTPVVTPKSKQVYSAIACTLTAQRLTAVKCKYTFHKVGLTFSELIGH